MLVLSRRINETIRIIIPNEYGEPTTVFFHIADVHGNTVRCGITAPPDVRVLREEITPKDQKETTPNPYHPTPLATRLAKRETSSKSAEVRRNRRRRF